MATKIQVRRGTASQWTTSDPTLSEGEVGFETDTGKFKIGDGTTVWSSLSYAGGSETLEGIDNVYETALAENDYLYYREEVAGNPASLTFGQDDFIATAKENDADINGRLVAIFSQPGQTENFVYSLEGSAPFLVYTAYYKPSSGLTFSDAADFFNTQDVPFTATGTSSSLSNSETNFSGGITSVPGGWYNKQFPDDPVMLSDSLIAENYEIPAGTNALSVGPVEVDTGVEVTVPTGSVWEISPWDAALSINDLSDVNTSGVSEGEVLTYSSGSWSFSSLPTLPKIQAVSQVIPSGTTNPFTITFPEAFSTVPTVVCQFEAVGYPEGGTLIVIENSITTTQFQLQLGGAGWPFTLHYIAIGT